MELQQYSLVMFLESLKSEKTQESYQFSVQKFIKYYKLKDYDDVVGIDKKELQKMVETYVIYLKKKISPNTIKTYLNPIKTFLEVNDIDLNWRKIKRLYPTKIKTSGASAYNTEDVKKMLDNTTDLRNKTMIHFIASSGVRVGAVPEMKLRHIRDMPLDCKSILVYEDSIEEYNTFLTPEASKSLDDYLQQRRKDGEILNDESPLFREFYQLGSSNIKSITTKAIHGIMSRVIKKSNLRGQKKNNRYSTQLVHGFRKRFDTILKLNKDVNDNIIEKMLGHKKGLDGVYFQPTIEQMFNEFKNGIDDLTISDDYRNKIKIEKLQVEKSELQNTKDENIKLQNKIYEQNKRLDKLEEQVMKTDFNEIKE